MPARTLLALISLASISACASHHRSAEPNQATAPASESAPSTVAFDSMTPHAIPYDSALETKQNAIETELTYLDLSDFPLNHWAREWAGTYYSGDGIRILIAPNSGVVYTLHGCMGLYDSAFGDIIQTFPGGVRIALKTPDKPSYRDYMSDTLYFVRWGTRQYLVPEARLPKMVDNFNKGGYAKSSMFGIPRRMGRNGRDARSEDTLPPGVPDAPAKWKAMFKERVITFTIVHASEPFGIKGTDIEKHASYRVRLDAGSKAGMFVGMTIDETRNGVWQRLNIDSVTDTESAGTLSLFGAMPSASASPVGITFTFRDRAP